MYKNEISSRTAASVFQQTPKMHVILFTKRNEAGSYVSRPRSSNSERLVNSDESSFFPPEYRFVIIRISKRGTSTSDGGRSATENLDKIAVLA